MKRFSYYLGLALLSFMFTACDGKEPEQPKTDTAMVLVEPDSWPDLVDDMDKASLDRALEQSRVYLRRLPADRLFAYGAETYTATHLLRSLDAFEAIFKGHDGAELKQALIKNFDIYQSVGRNSDHDMLCTGYYEPLLNGSLTSSDRYRWPIYGRPDDLIAVDLGKFSNEWAGKKIRGRIVGRRLEPYFSRNEIDRQAALSGRDLEIIWVDDPIALFFLHIQGSGRIRLEDGQTVLVGYATANGRPYRSLGRLMIDRGLIPKDNVSMQGISAWLKAHPDQASDLLDYNESYVFFQINEGGPVGNINVPLTPGRSIALDHRIFPKGALAWLQGRKPVVDSGRITGWTPFSRFVMVQDTGGAIKGPGRVDLFFGYGLDAETSAGHMKESTRLFFPVLKKPVSKAD